MEIKNISKKIIALFSLFILVFMTFVSSTFAAGVLNSQRVNLSTSIPALTTVTYTFHFKPSVNTKIEYVNLKFCTAPGTYVSSCTAAPSLSFTESSSSITGFGSGSTIGTPNFSSPPIVAVPITGSGTETVGTDHVMTMKNFTNPTAGVFYVRIQTYSDEGTTVIDDGTVAAVTIAGVTVSGTQRESLNVVVTANTTQASPNPACDVAASGDIDTTDTATTVPFGDFEAPSGSKIGSHQIEVDTNAGGYTIDGLTTQLMTSGSNTITGPTAATWVEGTTTGFGICADGARTHSKQWDNPTTLTNLTTYNGGSVDNDYTYVYQRAAVLGTTVAGTYQTTLTYIVTPIY